MSVVSISCSRCAEVSGHSCGCSDYTGFFMEGLKLPLDHAAIERILPHRYPFLLVDRITEIEVDKRIVGIKNVTLNERYLAHRPGQPPTLPPTILTEAIARSARSDSETGSEPSFAVLHRPRTRALPPVSGHCRDRSRRHRLRSRMGILHGIARVEETSSSRAR